MRLRKKPNSPYWYVDFSLSRGRGTPRRHYSLSTHTKDKTLAWEIARARQKEKLREFYGVASNTRLSLEELLQRYMDWLRVHRAERTAQRAESAIRNVLVRLKVRFPDEISSEKLTAFRKRRLREARVLKRTGERKKLSAFTVNVEIRHLRAFLRRCVRSKWLAQVPCDFDMVKLRGGGRVVFLTQEEVGPFLENLPAWARWAAYLILNTGLRYEEAAFLEWPDLDLEAGEVWVQSKPDRGFHTKGGKARSIPLTPEIAAELAGRRKDSGWVLEAPGGGQMKRQSFVKAVRVAGERATLPKRITPHVLRHTYASHLAMSGVDIQTIKELLGHSSILTTAIYMHTDAEHRRRAVAKLRMPGIGKDTERVIQFPSRGESGKLT